MNRIRLIALAACLCTAAALGILTSRAIKAQSTTDECEEERYSGIRHCLMGQIQILRINPDDPYVRLETVLAQGKNRHQDFGECRDVNLPAYSSGPGCVDADGQYPVERVPHMGERLKAVAGINADLFAKNHTHGPEGLTVKKGDRFDGWQVEDCDGPDNQIIVNGHCYANDTRRSSLAISRHNRLEIGPKSIPDLDNTSNYADRFYNVVSGLPLLVHNGQPVNITTQCGLEGGNCPDPDSNRARTAVGKTASGEIIIVVVPERPGVKLRDFAAGDEIDQPLSDILIRLGAVEAINLDGGTSSQLWYDNQCPLSDCNLAPVVAEGLLIFHDVRRHDAELIKQSAYPIVQQGEVFTLSMTLQNVGGLDWRPDLPYGLLLTGGTSFGGPTWLPVSAEVPPFAEATWNIQLVAPFVTGARASRWQMAYQDPATGDYETFGEEVGCVVTILPKGSSPDLAEAIRQLVDQAKHEAEQQLSDFLENLRKQIEDRINEELNRRLPWSQCLGGPAIGLAVGGWSVLKRRRGKRQR